MRERAHRFEELPQQRIDSIRRTVARTERSTGQQRAYLKKIFSPSKGMGECRRPDETRGEIDVKANSVVMARADRCIPVVNCSEWKQCGLSNSRA